MIEKSAENSEIWGSHGGKDEDAFCGVWNGFPLKTEDADPFDLREFLHERY